MKKYRIKGMEKLTDCRQVINSCVDTVDGLESAHIDLQTGEITYKKGTCNENQLKKTFADKGLELEES